MSLDIGEAFGEGVSRTVARNGLVLAAGFAAIALLFSVLQQTLWIRVLEEMLAFYQTSSPAELGLTQTQYEQAVDTLRQQVDAGSGSPFTLGLSAGAAAAILLGLTVVAEAVSISAVRVFSTDADEDVTRAQLRKRLLPATLNGVVGRIVVSGLVFVGFLLLVVPGVFLAVAFFFVRQRIALEDENFVEAMSESWQLTKGDRFEVFAIAVVLLGLSLGVGIVGAGIGTVSTVAGGVLSAVLGGAMTAFGAAVVTRGYVQLTTSDDGDGDDPYDAALGPDDIPE